MLCLQCMALKISVWCVLALPMLIMKPCAYIYIYQVYIWVCVRAWLLDYCDCSLVMDWLVL